MSTYVWDYGIKGRNTLWEPHLNLSENERVTDYMINTDNSEFIENCTGYNYWHLPRGNRTERFPLGFYGIFPLGTQSYIKKALKKFKDKMDASFPSVEYIKHTIYKWVRFTMPFTAELHNKHKECCVSLSNIVCTVIFSCICVSKGVTGILPLSGSRRKFDSSCFAFLSVCCTYTVDEKCFEIHRSIDSINYISCWWWITRATVKR